MERWLIAHARRRGHRRRRGGGLVGGHRSTIVGWSVLTFPVLSLSVLGKVYSRLKSERTSSSLRERAIIAHSAGHEKSS